MISAVLLSTLALVRCSDSGTDNDDQPNFEVREWGVLVGCVEDVSYFLTSRPEVSSLVRLPVIYVHSQDKTPLSIKATFKTGGPSDAYPPCDMSKSTVEWQNVQFPVGATQEKLISGKEYEPLEHIIPTLNNVDADILEYGGWLSRFLFYEGSIRFTNRLIATYDRYSYVAGVTNQGDFTVYNVNLIVRRQNTYGPTPQCLFAHWDKLDPGQTISGSLAEEPAYSYLADMKSLGFSQMEAESFATIWEPTLNMSGSLNAMANLVYRLPQAEFDSLINLAITPAPDRLV